MSSEKNRIGLMSLTMMKDWFSPRTGTPFESAMKIVILNGRNADVFNTPFVVSAKDELGRRQSKAQSGEAVTPKFSVLIKTSFADWK